MNIEEMTDHPNGRVLVVLETRGANLRWGVLELI